MKKVNFYVFQDIIDKTTDIIVEDGGVASIYQSEDPGCCLTDYYQSRLTPDTVYEDMWEELGEGKSYCCKWDGLENTPLKTSVDEEVILDAVHWLYMPTEEVEFVRNDMGELNKQSYKSLLTKLKLD